MASPRARSATRSARSRPRFMSPWSSGIARPARSRRKAACWLEASRSILEIYAALSDQLRQTRSVIEGKLRIGSIFSIGLHELPPRLQMFRDRHPEVDVSVEYRRSPEIYDLVRNGEVDVGLVAYPQYRRGLKFEIFEEDELVVVCHPKHPLVGRKTVALSDLNGQRFIAFDPDIPTRKVHRPQAATAPGST